MKQAIETTVGGGKRLARALLLAAAIGGSATALSAAGGEPADPGKAPDLAGASWIWCSESGLSNAGPVGYFRRKFVLDSAPAEATIALTADNGFELYVNNRRIAGELGYGGASWGTVKRLRIEKDLVQGANVIAIQGENLGGPGGVVAAVYVKTADGHETTLATDAGWLASAEPNGNWTEPDHDDSLWKPAAVLTRLGGKPGGALSVPDRLTDPGKLVVDRSVPGGAAPRGRAAPRGGPDRFTEPDAHFAWPAGIVFVGGRAPLHSTRAQTAKWPVHGSRAFFEYDTPAPAASGHRLYVMKPARPGTPPRLLVDAGRGLVASPACSYDGEEILLAMAPEGEKFFHVYRIGADGSGLAQLTFGPWHDYDPAALPDGRIVFASTRIGSRDEYHANAARSLFCLSADRARIRPLTYHIVADVDPAVMADGRIAFVRQDNFLERAKVETHIHCVHPDGTGGEVLVGPDRGPIGYDRPTGAEDSYSWLRNYGFGSPAPLPDGRVACLSSFGPLIAGNFLSARAGKERMPSDVGLFDIAPLPDGRLLAGTLRGALAVLDPDTGAAVRLLEPEGQEFHSVAYLGSRPMPPALAPAVRPEDAERYDKTGFLFSQCIFNTKQVRGDWERVCAVRVFAGRPFALRSAHHQYCHVGVEGIELGTAPLAPDGSFYLRVPADQAMAVQAVDAEGRAVVNELSWIYVRPGEKRSCTGCHNHRQATPAYQAALAGLGRPVDLLPVAAPHRFRANNAANGGVLNLQLERFREVASIDLYPQPAFPPGGDAASLPPGRGAEVRRLCRLLAEGNGDERVSAARRLGIFRDRAAEPALVAALGDERPGVRTAAAMSLAACGTRQGVPALLKALDDAVPEAAQAAHVAVEHLTGHPERFNAYSGPRAQAAGAEAWRARIAAHDWAAVERDLAARVDSPDPVARHLAIEALGHVGTEPGKAALRKYLQSGRSDSLVERLAAIRAVGHLRDEQAVPLLAGILEEHITKTPVRPAKSHEFGWAAAPDHLAGAAAEALGWIGTPQAEDRLIAAFGRLAEFWYYTFRTADHDWLMGCHSSIPHYRIAEALDAVGSRKAAGLTGKLLESVPIDTDRGLLLENDDYETVTARVIQRNGMGPAVVETCLAVLGDPEARPAADLRKSVTASPPAVSVGPLCPESRAAHLLSVVCLRPEDAPRVRAAFERYRAGPPSRKRSWACFFLARTLGKLGDRASVDALCAALDDGPTEAEQGIPDPPNVFLHNAMTPLYRAAAADALGRIGEKQAVPSLMAAVGDYRNAMDVRHAAADALRRIADPATLAPLQKLAEDYPEVLTQRVLWEACAAAGGGP